MNKLNLEMYNLDMTLLGGQAFNFDLNNTNDFYYGFTNTKIIKLKKEDKTLVWQTYPNTDDYDFLKRYLRLDINYKDILNKIQKDKYIKRAINKYPNLRLLKQDFEQTVLSFIISSNQNIKSIRNIIRKMSRKFGSTLIVDDCEFFLFPDTKSLANASLKELLECSLGYRAKYVKKAASHLLDTKLKNKIQSLNESNARKALLKIDGIGEKIADCILVFSLAFDNITPLDIWGKRVLTRYYKLNQKMKYEEMRCWIDNYFEGYAAWAGQFLFEYIRNLDIKPPLISGRI